MSRVTEELERRMTSAMRTAMMINGWYSVLVTREGQEAELAEVIAEKQQGAHSFHDALCFALRAGINARMAYLVMQADGDVLDVESAWQTYLDAEEHAEAVTRDTPKYPASVLPVKLEGGAR